MLNIKAKSKHININRKYIQNKKTNNSKAHGINCAHNNTCDFVEFITQLTQRQQNRYNLD